MKIVTKIRPHDRSTTAKFQSLSAKYILHLYLILPALLIVLILKLICITYKVSLYTSPKHSVFPLQGPFIQNFNAQKKSCSF